MLCFAVLLFFVWAVLGCIDDVVAILSNYRDNVSGNEKNTSCMTSSGAVSVIFLVEKSGRTSRVNFHLLGSKAEMMPLVTGWMQNQPRARIPNKNQVELEDLALETGLNTDWMRRRLEASLFGFWIPNFVILIELH